MKFENLVTVGLVVAAVACTLVASADQIEAIYNDYKAAVHQGAINDVVGPFQPRIFEGMPSFQDRRALPIAVQYARYDANWKTVCEEIHALSLHPKVHADAMAYLTGVYNDLRKTI